MHRALQSKLHPERMKRIDIPYGVAALVYARDRQTLAIQ